MSNFDTPQEHGDGGSGDKSTVKKLHTWSTNNWDKYLQNKKIIKLVKKW